MSGLAAAALVQLFGYFVEPGSAGGLLAAACPSWSASTAHEHESSRSTTSSRNCAAAQVIDAYVISFLLAIG
jgi:hypothetical protein